MRLAVAAILLCVAATGASADTGRDLLKICRQSASLCNSDFQSDEVAAALKTNACLPGNAVAARLAMVDWLGKHPRTARLNIARAVKAAATALWPCPK